MILWINIIELLVPHDFSEYSIAGFRYAIALADMFDVSITIQYIFETSPHSAIYMQSADTPALSSMEMKTQAKKIIGYYYWNNSPNNPADNVQKIRFDDSRSVPVNKFVLK